MDVFSSGDQQEYTQISFTPSTRVLVVNRTYSSLSPDDDHTSQSVVVPQVNHLQSTEFRIHVILDHSIIEVFADGVACITRYFSIHFGDSQERLADSIVAGCIPH